MSSRYTQRTVIIYIYIAFNIKLTPFFVFGALLKKASVVRHNRPFPRRRHVTSLVLDSCSVNVHLPPGYGWAKGTNTERLEQFSSIRRSPIIKPFMPAGYARPPTSCSSSSAYSGRPRSLSSSSPAFPSCCSQRNRIRLLFFPTRLDRLLVSCAKAPLTLGRASRSPRYYDVTVPSLTLPPHLARSSPFSSSPHLTFLYLLRLLRYFPTRLRFFL